MKTAYKNIILGLVVSTMLSGCNTWSRLSSIGKEPELAPIENPVTQPNYQPVALPMPPVAESQPAGANSLWKKGSSGFFKDQRASKVGDIITVNISAKDAATLKNKTEQTRDTNSDTVNVGSFFGYESYAKDYLPDAVDAGNLVNVTSDHDISGEGTNPVKQTELLNRLTTDFVKTKGDVAYLTVCPTDYSKLWANPTPQGPLAIYGETLDPSVEVFWTGDVVCSDLTPETMAWVNSRIKRPAYFWWNYPVTDYVRHIILQGPVYGLDTTLTSEDLCGIASNPMEHGEASKLALYGVADYTWNVSDYNPIDNWERGLGELMPKAREAYRTFAIHSCDTENGYRRDESWETRTFRLADWNDAAAEALWQEFDRVEKAPGEIDRGCTNRQLVKELGPWLQEFEKLGARGKRTIELARLYRSNGDRAEFWNRFVQNLMSDSARADYETHKVGTMKLQPFYENAMDDMAHGFLARVCGETPLYYKGIGSFSTVRTPQAKLMLDHDTATYYTSGIAQKAGDWIGLDLGKVEPVIEVSILQGRNSVDDVDYFDHAVVEYSVDGKTWKPLTGELKQQYIIDWQGEAVQARYVRLKRLESARTNYAAIRSFEVNPPRLERLGFDLKADDVAQALYLFDGQLATSCQNRGVLTFGVKPGVKSYTLLMNDREDNGKLALTVKQLAADGLTLAETEVTTPFHTIELLPGAATIQILGEAEIFEIVPVKR